MANKHITKQQVELFMTERKKGNTQKVAAAKAGISLRSAKRIQKVRGKTNHSSVQAPQKNPRDPLGDSWEAIIVPLLERDPSLQATTLLEELQDRYPEKYPSSLLRTLQRRIFTWKSLNGPEKEVVFRQENPPGWQGISDFTCCNGLDVTIQGMCFPHLLYHFRIPYSSWEYAFVITGGESYAGLSEGLQESLWRLGGVPKTHRTDSLAAAYKNLHKKAHEDFTKAYKELCDHYKIEATRNNKGVAHENGSIESSHRHLKSKIDQKLRLQGSRDFASLEAYREFVQSIVDKRNVPCQRKLEEERKHLRPLPAYRTRDYDTISTHVNSTSVITVKQCRYSVPSQLIGSKVTVRIYDGRIECYVNTTLVATHQRLRWKGATSRPRKIDYHHLIYSLVRKPQAFRNYVFRDDLIPTDEFRRLWELLNTQQDERSACKEYVKILKLAADGHENRIIDELRQYFKVGRLPKSSDLKELFEVQKGSIPRVLVAAQDPRSYDLLLSINAE